jgi:hypothetical protein
MRNIEVIKQFLNKSSGNSDTGNLISDGIKLFSYNTCIAEWTDDFVLFNVTKYSRSTSRIQSMILRELKTLIYKSVFIDNVPINTKYLWEHKEKM